MVCLSDRAGRTADQRTRRRIRPVRPDQFGDHGVIQLERGDQLRVVPHEHRGVGVGEHGHRSCSPQQIVLSILDDGLHRLFLGRRGRGEVVVGFDLRAVVRIDGDPALSLP